MYKPLNIKIKGEKMKKKILKIIILFIFLFINIKAQDSFYISPGISLSWGGDASMMFGWKISLGYVVMEKYYYNITFGKQKTILSEINSNNLKYSYFEVQRGDFLGYYPLSAGGGIGMTILNDKVYPRLSLYTGALVFINFNYTINKNVFDLGGKLVLPIPFKEEYRRLGPG
jgi:hypothetical protein